MTRILYSVQDYFTKYERLSKCAFVKYLKLRSCITQCQSVDYNRDQIYLFSVSTVV